MFKSKEQLEELYKENNIKTDNEKIEFLMAKLKIWKFDSQFFHQEDKQPSDIIKVLESIAIQKA